MNRKVIKASNSTPSFNEDLDDDNDYVMLMLIIKIIQFQGVEAAVPTLYSLANLLIKKCCKNR